MTIFNLWFTFGSLVEAILAFLVLPTLGFRWLIGLSSLPILLLSFAFPFVRESLQWLVAAGKSEVSDAIFFFAWAVRTDMSLNDSLKKEVIRELDTMYGYSGRVREVRRDLIFLVRRKPKQALQDDVMLDKPAEGRGNILNLFRTEYLRRTVLFCLIWFCVNLVYYGWYSRLAHRQLFSLSHCLSFSHY